MDKGLRMDKAKRETLGVRKEKTLPPNLTKIHKKSKRNSEFFEKQNTEFFIIGQDAELEISQ